MTTGTMKPRCDSCESATINGLYCHETGCRHAGKTWDAEREQWVRYVECFYCGCEVEAGEYCGCDERDEYDCESDEDCE